MLSDAGVCDRVSELSDVLGCWGGRPLCLKLGAFGGWLSCFDVKLSFLDANLWMS